MDFEFGELKNDENFVSKVQTTSEAISKIEQTIKDASKVKIDELSTEEKIKYDLFLTYAVNSLYWMYLKINGENPNTVIVVDTSDNKLANKVIILARYQARTDSS